jgi:hypothetical protein
MRYLLILLVALLGSCGGGGSNSPAPEIALTTASQSVIIANTGKTLADHRMVVKFHIRFEDFFRCSPGHAGFMLHAATENLPTAQYRGVGLVFGVFGNDSHTTRFLPNYQPVAVIETWAVGAEGPNFDPLLAQSVLPDLKDGPEYAVEIRSTPTAAGNAIGYTWDGQSKDEIDINPVVNMDRQEMVIFNATDPGTATCPYAVHITGLTEEWSPT